MFGIDDAVAAGSKLIDDVVTRIWPDATEVEKAKISQVTEQAKIELSGLLGQLEINKAEAAHPSIFVAGWRPFIGWVGGLGVGYQVLLMPIGNGIAACFGLPTVFIGVDISLLQSLIGGMLGLGLARSWDKKNGADTKQLK